MDIDETVGLQLDREKKLKGREGIAGVYLCFLEKDGGMVVGVQLFLSRTYICMVIPI
jgi:hypothetical protein